MDDITIFSPTEALLVDFRPSTGRYLEIACSVEWALGVVLEGALEEELGFGEVDYYPDGIVPDVILRYLDGKSDYVKVEEDALLALYCEKRGLCVSPTEHAIDSREVDEAEVR